jgi:hypothetical protein
LRGLAAGRFAARAGAFGPFFAAAGLTAGLFAVFSVLLGAGFFTATSL